MRGHHSEQVRTDGRNAGTLTTSELIADLHAVFAPRSSYVTCMLRLHGTRVKSDVATSTGTLLLGEPISFL
jgi:hypothetical protein